MSPEMPGLYALLIGIDYYFPNQLPGGYEYRSLGGCVRDINHVEEFLRHKLGIPLESILKLTATNTGQSQPHEPREQWPTHENMVAKLGQIASMASPGDQVYIHYSGHGGRATTVYPDLKGSNGVDEALVPTDIGNSEARYLRDVEIAHLLKTMVDKKLIVTVVLDSCHSGGATRGLGGGVPRRATPIPGATAGDIMDFVDIMPRPTDSQIASPEELKSTWRSLPGGSTRDFKPASGWLLEPQGYTLLAACRASESAYEFLFDGREKNGALTYWLLNSLKDIGPGLTYKTLHDRILAKVHSQFQSQTPQLQGNGNREVFGSEQVQPHYAVTVMQVDADRVMLGAGQAHGLRKGAQFVIYPSSSDLTQVEQRLALVEIMELGATESWAKIAAKLRPDAIVQGDQAVLMDPGSICLQRAVRVLIDQAEVKTQLEAAIGQKGSGFLRLAADGEPVDFQVTVKDANHYEIWDPAGTTIANLRPDIGLSEQNAAARVVQRLVHLTKYRNVQQLDNYDAMSPLARKLLVELVGVQSDYDPADKPHPKPFADPGNTPTIKVGDWIFLRVRNNLPPGGPNDPLRILNVTVLDLQPAWGITQIYPSGAGLFEPLDPGREVLLPLQTSLPEGYQDGTDLIKVFATIGTTNFRWLQLPTLDEPLTRGGATCALIADPLERLLATITGQEPKTRDLNLAQYPSREWVTGQVEVHVKKSMEGLVNTSADTAPAIMPVPQNQNKTAEDKGGEIMANANEVPKVNTSSDPTPAIIPAPQNQDKTGWTPEQNIQRFKEWVTGLLGVCIVLCTLILAGLTFRYVGNSDKLTNAKDILQILLGLAGVVTGYYFGRMPADARAAQSQDQAIAATAQAERVSAEAQGLADQVQEVMDKTTPGGAAARGASSQPLDSEVATDLQRIRNELRALSKVRHVK